MWENLTVREYQELSFEDWVTFLNLFSKQRSYVMSLMQVDTSGAVEPIALPAGTETKLRIVSAKKGKDKNDDDYIQIVFEIPEEPSAKEFSWLLYQPSSKFSPKRLNRVKWDWVQFGRTFKFDLTRPFDPEDDFVGLEGWVILGLRSSDDYGEQNSIRKFVPPTE